MIILLILTFLLLLIPFHFRRTSSWTGFIFLIPIIHAIADVTTNFFPPSTLNPGSVRAVIIFCFILVLSGRIIWNGPSIIIYAFLLYTLFLVYFTSDVNTSLKSYIKVFNYLMMVPLGITFIRNQEKLNKLNTSLIISVFIIIVQLLIAQILNLGVTEYVEGSFYQGGAGIGVAYLLSLGIIVYPLIQSIRIRRKFMFLSNILIGISAITVLLLARRGAILAALAGVMIFLLMSSNRKRAARYIIFIILILAIASPFYYDIAFSRLDVRSSLELQEIGRYLETQVVFRELINQDWSYKLFGSEVYNSLGYFRSLPSSTTLDTYNYVPDRQLHIDFNILLNGTGLVGLLLYFLIYLSLITHFMRSYKSLKEKTKYFRILRAIFWALIISSLLISASGSMFNSLYRSCLFLYLGALIGIVDEARRTERFQTADKPEGLAEYRYAGGRFKSA